MNATRPGADGTHGRRPPRGRPSVDRALPEPKTATLFANLPYRILKGPWISPSAKVLGLIIAATARHAMASDSTNDQLAERSGLSPRQVVRALEELETAGWIYRLLSYQDDVLEYLVDLRYSDPWAGDPTRRPRRVLVLLWLLPGRSAELREGVTGDTLGDDADDILKAMRAEMDHRLGGGSARRRRHR